MIKEGYNVLERPQMAWLKPVFDSTPVYTRIDKLTPEQIQNREISRKKRYQESKHVKMYIDRQYNLRAIDQDDMRDPSTLDYQYVKFHDSPGRLIGTAIRLGENLDLVYKGTTALIEACKRLDFHGDIHYDRPIPIIQQICRNCSHPHQRGADGKNAEDILRKTMPYLIKLLYGYELKEKVKDQTW